ncbi:MAG TPA: riboflavin synthase [Candidatus Saccharimonadia bacterium]|nr:riboflavin synthase [Candidatus Saccharimonadia bacterium]
MFTGIIQHVGEVTKLERLADSIRLGVSGVPADVAHGESVAVNGVCLTATGDARHGVFMADVMDETLKHTTLGSLQPGDRVNLERAATLGSFLGGHLVQGHVDGVGTLTKRTPGEAWEVLRFEAPPEVLKYLVSKGSITVSGVSLTVVEPDRTGFSVSLIPTTLRDTTLGRLQPGDHVNLEADVIGKYVAAQLAAYRPTPAP